MTSVTWSDAGILAAGLLSLLTGLSVVVLSLVWIERKFLGQVRLVTLGQGHARDNGSFTLTSGFLSHYPNPSSIATGPLNSAVDTFVANTAGLLPRGIRLNVVSPAPVVDVGNEGKGRVTAEQTARFYVEAVQGEMTGHVLRAWGGLPVPEDRLSEEAR